MMSLLFLLVFVAMLCAFTGKKAASYIVFTITVALGLYWFHHHATDSLSILL
ncbi:DUF5993 family protein [Photobacterium malacitanum]|uniref:DUF5993 family protein n=1 Tax=Photobacterium malacitanum TaxID=2204294 RepID=UPI001F193587|nr:DUF5993 family protein [Photobacterium malacitanum]